VKAGARSISDLYQQQATTASARAGVVAAEQAVELARIALIQTLQLDPRASYDFVSPAVADASSVPRYDLDSLLTRAFTSRSDLAAEQTRVDAAATGTKAAASGRLPTVSLSTSYNASYNSALANALGNQLDQSRGGSMSIGVSFPLFDRGATSVAVQQAKIQEDNARLQLANEKQAVALDVRRAYLALAKRDTASALNQLVTTPDTLHECWYETRLTLVQLLVAAGRYREAASRLERRWPGTSGCSNGVDDVLWAMERARVFERLGRRAEAAENYALVADAWRTADMELQPYVRESHAALTRLKGGSRSLTFVRPH